MAQRDGDPMRLQAKEMVDQVAEMVNESINLKDENAKLKGENAALRDNVKTLESKVDDQETKLNEWVEWGINHYPLPPIIGWSKVRFGADGVPYNVDDPGGVFMTDPEATDRFVMIAHPCACSRILKEQAKRGFPRATKWFRSGPVPESG